MFLSLFNLKVSGVPQDCFHVVFDIFISVVFLDELSHVPIVIKEALAFQLPHDASLELLWRHIVLEFLGKIIANTPHSGILEEEHRT